MGASVLKIEKRNCLQNPGWFTLWRGLVIGEAWNRFRSSASYAVRLYPIIAMCSALNLSNYGSLKDIRTKYKKVDSQVELNTLLLLSYPAVHDQLSTRIPYLEDRTIRGLTER